MFALTIEVAPAATAIRARVRELAGAAGATGLLAGVPVTTAKDTELVAPE